MKTIVLPKRYEIDDLLFEIRSHTSERMFPEDQENIDKAVRSFVRKYVDKNAEMSRKKQRKSRIA